MAQLLIRRATALVARGVRTPARAFGSAPDIWDTQRGHVDSYYSRTADIPRVPYLQGHVHADVAIVGGGLAGINVAYELSKRGARVALLEANRLAWAASGRNGGFAHPGYSLGLGELAGKLGTDHARALWNLTFDSLDMMRGRIAGWAASGRTAVADSVQEGMLSCNWFNTPGAFEEDVAWGNGVLQRDYFQYWPRERVNATYETKRYYDGCYDPASFHLHSMQYALETARDAMSLGAQLYEQSPIQRIYRDEAVVTTSGSATASSSSSGGGGGGGGGGARGGIRRRRALDASSTSSSSSSRSRFGKHVLETPTGRVTADKLVLCTSSYLPGIDAPPVVKTVARAVLPVFTYACVTEPLGADRLASVMKAPHAVTDSRFACDYYRPLKDTRVLWGGRIDCMGIPEAKLPGVLKADLCTVYPQLADVKIEAAWQGVMGYGMQKMPLIGHAPGDPSTWYCTAFGGHGVCPTTIAGDIVASAIAPGSGGGDQRYKLFSPFKPYWTGGPVLGAIGAQAWYWAYEARDRLHELRYN